MRKNRILRYSFAAMIGVILGLGAFTFRYAEGLSYFSSDPRACLNCHIMKPEFDSWQKSSHHHAAVCVDCHLPHNTVEKYIAKADNGYHHSKGFTFQDFHEPILMTPKSSKILQENCLRCHEALVQGLHPGAFNEPEAVQCVHCHSSAGHGETAGLGRSDQNEKL